MSFEYRKGERQPVLLPLDSSSADIVVGDAITATDPTPGYFKEVDATTEVPLGIAMQTVEAPDSDGGAYVLVDISPDAVYEVSPDSGTVGVTLVMKTMDCGADARSVDINGSSADNILCVGIDTDANTLLCQIRATYAGVA